MISRPSHILVILSLFFLVYQARNVRRGRDNDDALVCRIVRRDMAYRAVNQSISFHHDESYDCFQGDVSYDLPLAQAFIDSHPDLDEGLTRISIPGGSIVNGTTVTYPSNTIFMVLPKQEQRRRLSSSEGNRTVLIVRVTDFGRNFYPGDWTLRERIFDDRPGTLFHQMRSCSRGKLDLQMAQGPGINIGIHKVRLGFDSEGMLNRDVERAAVQKLDAIGGESAYDHVLYVLPPGIKDRKGKTDWVGYALLNTPRSVYNAREAQHLSVLMHEVGHNFGLSHANQWGYAYADETGNMGFTASQQLGPRACYNGQKHWQLGWYDDKSIDLSNTIRSKSWGGRLVAFVDADRDTVDGDAVILRIGNLYAQFNRRKDFNDGTRELRDLVTIVSADNRRNPQSSLEAGIGFVRTIFGVPETVFAFPNFEGTGHDLVFEACEQVYGSNGSPDYMHLSIHLDDGTQSSMCNVPLPSPTISLEPSNSPTTEPTTAPSSSPTKEPTTAPTNSPTDRVTPSPSAAPSAVPTMDCTGMDLSGPIPIQGGREPQTCAWIGQRKQWKELLCRKGYEAFERCQETCDSCNAQGPEEPTTSDACEDSSKMFYVDHRHGQRRCWELGLFLGRPHNHRWKSTICAPGQPAYDHCPELCGKCTDTCEDQPDKTFNTNRRFGRQDCAWLSRRPLWQAKLCREGHDAYKYCNELCNTCP